MQDFKPQMIESSGWKVWPLGYWHSYNFQAKCCVLTLSRLCHFCLETIVPKSNLILNLSGREGNDLLIPQASAPSAQHEIFYLEGNFFQSDQNEIDHNSEQLKASFSIQLLSEFKEFPSNKDIAYQTRLYRRGALPEQIELFELGQALPIEPTYLRFALCRFKPKLFSFLGINPTITESIKIEANQSQFHLELYADSLKSPKEKILSVELSPQHISRLLEELFQIKASFN